MISLLWMVLKDQNTQMLILRVYLEKKNCLLDTLLESLTYDEIKSVLAHEIGHYKMKHIQKSLVIL